MALKDKLENATPKIAQVSSFLVLMHLRALLAKWPNICKPTFSTQYLFGCIIKSTHLGGVPKTKSWDLGAYTGLWWAISVLGLK